MDVVVVGAGVIGLTAARALVREGHHVTVVTRDDPLATTSAAAAASFKPRLVAGGPVTTDLLVRSVRVLADWHRAGLAGRFGLSRVTHVEAASSPIERDYLHVMDDVRWLARSRGDRLPPGTTHAVAYETWFLDVAVMLPALVADVTARGVDIVRATVADLDDVVVPGRRPDVVVHAAGVHAGELSGDPGTTAVRGQVVAVDRAVSGVATSVSTDQGAYVYPRRHDILLGGTAEEVALAGLGVARPAPDAATTAAILARAGRLLAHLDPDVGDPGTWPVRAVAVGLRPWRRAGIRLEVDHDHPAPVIHAHGHGGAGWTLAAGTAEWITEAVAALPGAAP
jgi:D-amino-acid oxidase